MAERFFNTTGPVFPAKHYSIPPLGRIDLDEVLRLIRGERYFVLHAPRQTGKTSALLALRDLLNQGGAYRCVYTNVETGQTARGNVEAGMQTILGVWPIGRWPPWATTMSRRISEPSWRPRVRTARSAGR